MSYFNGKRVVTWNDTIEDEELHDPLDFSEDVWELRDDGLFNIGPYSEGGKPKTQTTYCKVCNGRNFYIGQSTNSLWIGMKCHRCGWEVIIHEGC